MISETDLLDQLLSIRASVIDAERRARGSLEGRPPEAAESARNFVHYRALRAHDLRGLQDSLAHAGLSSLGRSEAHVLATLDAVIRMLSRSIRARGGDGSTVSLAPSDGAPTFESGRARLDARAQALLGPRPRARDVRIMATLGDSDAGDPARIRALLAAGVDLFRINTAHDDPEVWSALVRHVRAASERERRPCRILMDLAGPKLRTGPVSAEIVLRAGDALRLTRKPCVGEPARIGTDGSLVTPFVSCTLPEVLSAVRVGDPIWFDDGKIGAVVRAVDDAGVELEIRTASAKGRVLRADKGINVPESQTELPAITAADREHLPFVIRHADLVGVSFVHSPDDVAAIEAELARAGAPHGVVLKIETKRGFAALPSILVRALAARPVGVMIARGDLAVECGFERLAEVQEEMLWLCEAAHVPVIWATQVLDRLARKGMPTRAEITDAAMSERAECAMLNKGEHLVEAVRALDDILRRMASHQYKKSAALRRLSLSTHHSLP